MAIQPTARIAGSSHILRFQGTLLAGATPQTLNGTVPATVAPTANVPVEVKFALADMTALTDQTKRLPALTYDDGQPAAGVPHAVGGGPAGGGAPSALAAPSGRTWMQNVRVRIQENSASTATPLIAQAYALAPVAYVDTTITGLSQNTGTPVVGVYIAFTAAGVTAIGTAGAPGAGVPVVVEVEVPYTPIR